YAGDHRPALAQAAHGLLPAADAATAQQSLRRLRPTLAGGMHQLDDQAAFDEQCRRPLLLGAMPRTAADRPHLPMPAPSLPVSTALPTCGGRRRAPKCRVRAPRRCPCGHPHDDLENNLAVRKASDFRGPRPWKSVATTLLDGIFRSPFGGFRQSMNVPFSW